MCLTRKVNRGSKVENRRLRLRGRGRFSGAIFYPLSSILVLSSCQTVLPPKSEPVALMEDQQPLLIDDATQMRDFERSTVYYPSGSVEAGSTRFMFAPRVNASRVERGFVDPVMFAANVVTLPVTLFMKAPGTSYDWPAAVTDPSYTVQPAYPPEAPVSATTGTDAAADNTAGDPSVPVPEAQSPVPGPSEPVRNPGGDQPNLPTENQGVNEVPGRPSGGAPQPSAPPSGGVGGGGQ
jgi:hypothetical protein